MSMGKNRSASKHSGRGRVASGGGIKSLKVKNVRQGTRETPRVRGVNAVGANQLGEMQGNHSTDSGDMPFRREPLYQEPNFQLVPLGNTLTNNVGKGGPGTGRTLYGQAGTQCMTGKAAQGVPNTAPDVPATERSARSLSEKGRVG
jgi:hypothetical protein